MFIKKKINEGKAIKIADLYKKGLMGREIAEELNISLKQVYISLRHQQIPRKSLWEQNKVLFDKKTPSFSLKKNLLNKEKELLIAGVMLYYGEGAKTGRTVDFVNADNKAVKLFLKFLRNICQIDEKRLKFYLYCFSDQNAKKLIEYWSLQLRAGQNQFTKPFIRPSLNRSKRKILHGVLHVRYNDKKLLETILSLCNNTVEKLL
ncbi:MAG: hypothetical protein COU31_04455 [Candidatus Magasanikbacteria bacterium CG10_big_fil_rev_8_21_14_0_10_40_10]|uniref:Uncharacterized protein n=1 Tax=Candidatus Magasanikbacteria bacterium CG10_big_fil_rev_8_21_14_0_10_40_10 TaxID=1974648 RepID=A0A2M6W303_9BACT|nr:MAG: hypothetical protein COU31_04455 [Candidatus Magasanikbacteria bacterium CG10_big_fil_rev_8_21_14_0_10_40_10]